MPTPIEDIKEALHFLARKQPNILKLMLFATAVNFFVNGNSSVGFTYMVRATLGFNANVYGISEGIVGIAGVAGASSPVHWPRNSSSSDSQLPATPLPYACCPAQWRSQRRSTIGPDWR
jgi:hypothetical protein